MKSFFGLEIRTLTFTTADWSDTSSGLLDCALFEINRRTAQAVVCQVNQLTSEHSETNLFLLGLNIYRLVDESVEARRFREAWGLKGTGDVLKRIKN